MSARGIRAGSVVDGTDWKLPAIVQAYGNGSNTISATTFAVLPTTTCTGSMTNPHPSARLLVMAEYGAWLTAGASSDVRLGLAVSGSLTISGGIGNGGPIGWGEIAFSSLTTVGQFGAMCTYELPPGTADFSVHAYKTGANNGTVAFPTLALTPIRYLYD